jgi:hypothetical protein
VKDPVDHIARPALPWRSDPGITECGLNAAKVPTITREAYAQRLKDYGQQRSALVTCMTCGDTSRRWGTWEDDPRKAIEREVQWETAWRRDERGQRLRDELVAIAVLIEAHADEFQANLATIEQRREWNESKAKLAKKPKPRSTIIIGGL